MILLIGSTGFIRHCAIGVKKAATFANHTAIGDFFFLAIPSTLGNIPSYNASDHYWPNEEDANPEEDDIAMEAFRVSITPIIFNIEIQIRFVFVITN